MTLAGLLGLRLTEDQPGCGWVAQRHGDAKGATAGEGARAGV